MWLGDAGDLRDAQTRRIVGVAAVLGLAERGAFFAAEVSFRILGGCYEYRWWIQRRTRANGCTRLRAAAWLRCVAAGRCSRFRGDWRFLGGEFRDQDPRPEDSRPKVGCESAKLRSRS